MFFKRLLFSTWLTAFAVVSCVSKELCDFTDEVCLTNAEKKMFTLRITGNKAWGIESSEVLHEEVINVKLHGMSYTFTDVYLYGVKDCEVHRLKFNPDWSWYFYIICPRLTLKADYVEKGVMDSVPIDGKGKIVVIYNDYHVGTKGKIETVTGSDGKPRMNITNYDIDLLESKDKVTYKFTNVFSTDKEKSEKAHTFLNDNWEKVNREFEYPTLEPFVHQVLNVINHKFLVAVPMNEMFYKD